MDKLDFGWSVADANGKDVPKNTLVAGNEITLPPPTLLVPNEGILRFLVSHRISGVGKDRGGHLDLGWDHQWDFTRGDEKAYFLSGSMTGTGKGEHDWAGTIALPKAAIPPGE